MKRGLQWLKRWLKPSIDRKVTAQTHIRSNNDQRRISEAVIKQGVHSVLANQLNEREDSDEKVAVMSEHEMNLADSCHHSGYRARPVTKEPHAAKDRALLALGEQAGFDVVVPEHVAIIMDGNGRWAKKRGLPRSFGHRKGADKLKLVTEWCSDIGVKYLTVYAFSNENWSRPNEEVSGLMKLFVEFFQRYDPELQEKGIRMRFVGRRTKLPRAVIDTIESSEQNGQDRPNMQLIIAFNYGGRQELVDAICKLSKKISSHSIAPSSIDESMIRSMLYLPDVPDPDLIIRSSGEMRLSNFLLWQSAYSELWVSDVLWPDFSCQMLYQALIDFNLRDRRYGGIKE